MNEQPKWTDFDTASSQSLILAAWRSERISGTQAWDLFTQNGLWDDKEEAFLHYVNGREFFETSRELWTAQPNFKKAIKKLIRFGSQIELISPASAEWLGDLFGVRVGP